MAPLLPTTPLVLRLAGQVLVCAPFAVTLAGCTGSNAESPPRFDLSTSSTPSAPASRPPPTPPATRPSDTPASPHPSRTAASHPAGPAVVPADLVGTWRGLDQGSAEVVYRFHADGTYESAQLLMQERPSGTFTFSVGAAGSVTLDGGTLVLTQTRGRETMEDPDSPSSSFDRPLSPLRRLSFSWSVAGGRLTLANEYGPVTFERIGTG